FLGYRGTGSDITAEIEARRRADATHCRFVEAIEHIPASILLCDADERIVLCNSVTQRFFPKVAHLLVPGTRFEDLIRAEAETGTWPSGIGGIDDRVAERMQ